jgi:SecD/SecF fusion protein
MMNKRPVLFRWLFAAVVIAVFAFSIYPLQQRDFYKTFKSIAKNSDAPEVKKLVSDSKALQEKDNALFPSVALLAVAQKDGIVLKDLIKSTKDINDNRDVISLIRKKSSSSIRLGLDLNGGVEFMLELIPDKKKEKAVLKNLSPIEKKQRLAELAERQQAQFKKFRDQAIEILRARMESQQIFESEISPAGDKFISLRVPVVSKDEKVQLLKLIEMSAKLRFCLVHKDNDRLVKQYLATQAAGKKFLPPVGYKLMINEEFKPGEKPKKLYYFVERRPQMTGKNINDAFPTKDQFGQLKIILRFNSVGAKRFGVVTSEYKDRALAIVLDGKLYCAPYIRSAITDGSAEISGNFSNEEAKNISDALVSGSLPVRIAVSAIFDTAPTLGAANVENGIWAGIIALAVVMGFMLVYYLRAGVVAVIALVVNIVLVLGALAAFSATLTLPGIAGMILTIGMAVDANVLIFERIREELNKDKGLQNSIDTGYSKAFITILDANLTTLFTALILIYFGTGAIKGFAVTLSIGIATSMFTALFLTRLIFDSMSRWTSFKKLTMCHLLSHTNINFLGKRKIAAIISGSLIILSLIMVVTKGGNAVGIDFTGGTQITFDYSKQVAVETLIKALNAAGYKDAKAVYKSSTLSQKDNHKLEILIRDAVEISSKQGAVSPKANIASLLNTKFPEMKLTGGSESSLGGLIGETFRNQAALAIFLALIGIIIYISFRFEFAYAMASIIALVHDVMIATGIYIMLDKEISLPVIAALMTIIGYSLNDTIVVFDRIRENTQLLKGETYKDIINASINQTLSRTILTSVTTLLVLLVLYFFGGIAINDFVFVMLIGVIIGTYSSIFVASPIIAIWHKKIGAKSKEA